jgi:hypothetical protein
MDLFGTLQVIKADHSTPLACFPLLSPFVIFYLSLAVYSCCGGKSVTENCVDGRAGICLYFPIMGSDKILLMSGNALSVQ